MDYDKQVIINDLKEYLKLLGDTVVEKSKETAEKKLLGLFNIVSDLRIEFEKEVLLYDPKRQDLAEKLHNAILSLIENADYINAFGIAEILINQDDKRYLALKQFCDEYYNTEEIENLKWKEFDYFILWLANYIKANRDNDPQSQYDLALIFSEPTNFINNPYLYNQPTDFINNPYFDAEMKECVYWLKRAANNEHPIAQYKLSLLIRIGFITDIDIAESVNLLIKSAENGIADAQYELGCMYGVGDYLEQNDNLSDYWIIKSAEQGYVYAQYDLGLGKVLAKEYVSGILWLERAAKQGYSKAQYDLAICYKNGEGTPVNMKAALYWYMMAANQGDIQSKNEVGIFYEQGKYINQDLRKAYELYYEAAQKGNANAQFNLARFYRDGILDAPDMGNAIYWFKEAAHQGLELAISALNNFMGV